MFLALVGLFKPPVCSIFPKIKINIEPDVAIHYRALMLLPCFSMKSDALAKTQSGYRPWN